MQFVVKAVGPAGQAKWLTTPRREGLRTFGSREMAEVFATSEDAAAAIGATKSGQPCDGIIFSTEPTHQSGPDSPHFDHQQLPPGTIAAWDLPDRRVRA